MLRFLLIGSIVTLASTAEAEVTRGPYLQLATPDSMVVVWRTDEAIEPVVRIGEKPDALERKITGEAIVQRVSVDVAAELDKPFGQVPLLYDEPAVSASLRDKWDREPSTPPNTRQFEATIDGLKSGKKYYYAVYDGDTLIAGGDENYYLVASPPQDTQADIRLWVVGDSGTGGEDQRKVHEAMVQFTTETKRPLDGYLHVGDMAYGDGADIEFQNNFFAMYQSTLRNTVCWPAMGNHEGHTSRGMSQFGPYYDAYVVPTKAEAGGLASGTEAYYSFDIGRAHFVCLDSHDLDRSPNGAMAQWLAADLEEANSDWLIAFWHHPPYTKGSHDSDRERQLIEMRTYIMPLLESAGVDMVLSGHSHIYERSMLIDGAYATPTVAEGVILDDGDGRPDGDGAYRKSAGLKPNNGTLAIVSGHGGAGVSRKGTMPIMREIIVDHGSLILDIKGDTLMGTMIDKQGEIRDTFQVVKRGEVKHQPIENPWQPVHDPSLITEQRIEWSKQDDGKFPPGWSLVSGKEAEGKIAQRTEPPVYQLEIRAAEEWLAMYDQFDTALSEYETYLEFAELSSASAGVVFGWKSPSEHYRFVISPEEGVAKLVYVTEGKASVVNRHKLELPFEKPLKIELEPHKQILEVQINDQVEYTIPLKSGTTAGRVGLYTSGGAKVNIAGLTVEKGK